MKIRTSLVSNSSSSSFICDVCGEDYSGWDACLSEAEMFQCEYGHTVCLSHTIGEIDEDEGDYPYEVSEKNCPLCSFEKVDTDAALRYLLKSLNMTEDQLLKKLKTRFKDYGELLEYIK